MYDINDKLRNHNKVDYCFTIMCTNRGWGHRLSLIKLIYYISDNFCVMKIKHIMYNVQDYSVLYNSAVLLVMREGWHFTYTHGKHFHDRIMSLRGEVWFYKTSLTPAPFIKVPVRGHVFVCSGYRFCHFLRFSIWILKLFLQWDTFCSSY